MNARHDFHHKVSHLLSNLYKTIYIEDLNIAEMSRGLRLGKSINDAGWRTFIDMLDYKLEERGGQLVYVDPRGTSQLCSECGEYVPKELGERMHICPACGYTTDRDHNASRNVLKRGRGTAFTERKPLPQIEASVLDELRTPTVE